MQLHFHKFKFDLELDDDKVYVYYGSDTTAPLVYTFSLRHPPKSDVFSSGNTIFVSFVTDRGRTNKGFMVDYSTISPVRSKLQRFLCNSNDLKQRYLMMLVLFPIKYAYKTYSHYVH